VTVSDAVMTKTAMLCAHIGTDGLRGELTLVRAARALAALEGSSAVELSHVRRLATGALGHRLRRDPMDEVGAGARVQRAVTEVLGT
jgi:magnesium chelatase subunit I